MTPVDFERLSRYIAPNQTALIVVDVQNDFAHPEGKAAAWGGDMEPIADAVRCINRLIEAARAVGTAIVYVRIEHSPRTDRPNYRERYAQRRMDPTDLLCASGSWGAEFFGDLLPPHPDDAIITKYGYDAFQDTALDAVLHSRGVEAIVVTGLVSNLCVQTTAEHGFGLGYYVTIAADATAGDDLASHEAALRNLGMYFGLVATTDDILSVWQGERLSAPRKDS